MRVIYLDVLLIVNLFVNYFLLLSTAQLLHRNIAKGRMIIGAAIGSVFSLCIFLPELSLWIMLIIKLLMVVVIVLITFGFVSKPVYIKAIALFFGVNFIFAGVMLALWLVVAPPGMFVNNGVVYFNISAIALAVGTILSYLVIRLVSFVLDRRVHAEQLHQAVAEVDGKQVMLTALHDTGNHLVEMFSGLPVIVCEYQVVQTLLPVDLHGFFQHPSTEGLSRLSSHPWRSRVRLVSYNAVGIGGVIAAFKPDEFYLCSDKDKQPRDVYIGVTTTKLSQGEFDTILQTTVTEIVT